MTVLAVHALAAPQVEFASVAAQTAAGAMEALATRATGLTDDEVAARRNQFGANALRSHGARPGQVLVRQLRNPLLLLLLAAALVSGGTGNRADALIITVIVALSVGLGFFNEYRSEQAVEELHSKIRHDATVIRNAKATLIDVADLVPGDIVALKLGDIVPADMRLLNAHELECDEAILTGESLPAVKTSEPVQGETAFASCALMGTVVSQGSGSGVVVQTGAATAFGRIAVGLGERHAQTSFQIGLQQFSMFLVKVAGMLTAAIFVINVVLHKPVLDALLFSLAIAIGLTPQLLPAIVTVSLSRGTRRLAAKKVLVKRLVAIEDLGNITTLFTDKTGTLTEGRVTFERSLGPDGVDDARAHLLGLVCNEATVTDGRAVSGNQLDVALWDSAGALTPDALAWIRQDAAPFDHERRLSSVIAVAPDGTHLLVAKGEPEGILDRCLDATPASRAFLDQLFDAGSRVIAVATKSVATATTSSPSLEYELNLEGFLVFVDRPKMDAGTSIRRLADLGVVTKVITGDSERVARKVCGDLGIDTSSVLVGSRLVSMSDDELMLAIATTSVFARIDPDQKSRIIRMARHAGEDVAFLGDGVNDALALHHADVGISVDTATDVAKDAADILLLDKDLGVLADGIQEGRCIFANTIKYVLMATSSNFGNMFSAAGASIFLSFLPMLPSQILLNNLLYDVGQMTIPTDNVDNEMLSRPSQWDLHFIRRFMGFFGPMSSIFDFATFFILLHFLHAKSHEFRTGWFVESLATQTLVIFVIRTHRVPFFRSRPSIPLLVAIISCVAVGAVLPFTPLAEPLGFTSLPISFFLVLLGLIGTYLILAELGKRWFYASLDAQAARVRPVGRRPHIERRAHKRAARFTHDDDVSRADRRT